MKVIEWVVVKTVGPFLEVYIMLFGDDPEMIAYAGLAFVIYYAAVFILGMAAYEAIRELKPLFRFRYWVKRKAMRRRIHRAVEKKIQRKRLEDRIQRKIFNELPGEEGKR